MPYSDTLIVLEGLLLLAVLLSFLFRRRIDSWIERRTGPRDIGAFWVYMVLLYFVVLHVRSRDDRLLWFYGFLFVLLVVIYSYSSIQWRRRQAWLSGWAAGPGFTVVSNQPEPIEQTLSEGLRALPLFRRGSLLRTLFLLRGAPEDGGRELWLFDYDFRVPTPLGSTRVPGPTVIAARTAGLGLPAFELRPAGLPGRYLGVLGPPTWNPVALPGVPGSSGHYTLCGPEAAALSHLSGPAVLAALNEHPGWCLEGGGEWMLAYHYDKPAGLITLRPPGLETIGTGKIAERLDEATHLFDLIASSA